MTAFILRGSSLGKIHLYSKCSFKAELGLLRTSHTSGLLTVDVYSFLRNVFEEVLIRLDLQKPIHEVKIGNSVLV